MKNAFFLLLTFFTSITLFGQDIIGKWEGTIIAPGAQIKLVFNISKTKDAYSATMDSPDQGAFGIPMTITTFSNSVLKCTIEAAQIEYQGTLNNNEIIGFFKQGGQSIALNLSKAKEETATIAIETNTNYIETPIVLETATGKIYGTLTTPKELKTSPVALIIAGSGPTDRNCNNPSMRSNAYKILAHSLADNKIASVRYDKRGIAESSAAGKKESELRFEDLIDDAKGWVNFIKQDNRFTKITIIGHSEGSLIGMKASGNADKYISIAGPGRPADVILKEQLSTQSQEYKDVAFFALDELVKGKTVDNLDPKYNDLFRQSIQPYLISWFQYNPQTEIQKLNIPTLIIQGSNDIQIAVSDAELLARANKNSELIIINNMNHVLRTVTGDRSANLETYNNHKLPLSDGFVEAITTFILK
jgi:pimeloyl-ACP methyl ester carboxylesterase